MTSPPATAGGGGGGIHPHHSAHGARLQGDHMGFLTQILTDLSLARSEEPKEPKAWALDSEGQCIYLLLHNEMTTPVEI